MTAPSRARGSPTSPRSFAPLDDAGYRGWYDVEIFSDAEEDSLWALPADEAARRARESFDRVWAAATGTELVALSH